METVLYTEQAGSGHVIVREIMLCPKCARNCQRKLHLAWMRFRRTRQFGTVFCYGGFNRGRDVQYSPRPGTFEAIGCWSRLGDAETRFPSNLPGPCPSPLG